MKIVLVGDGFTGATLPLAKRFAEKGHEVCCFYYVNVGKGSLEGFDFLPKICPGIYKINLNNTNLSGYFNPNISVYVVVLLRERKKAKKFHLNFLLRMVDTWTEKRLINKIKSFNYDVINLIGHNYPLDYLIDHLDQSKIFCSVHEVLANHLLNDKCLNKYTQLLMKKNINIVVHSEYSLIKLCGYKKCWYIPFGAFETLKTFPQNNSNLHSGYFLFYGYILPYKGLELLYNAYIKLKNKGIVLPIVIAGKGNDKYLDLFAKEPNIFIINKYLTNFDLAGLITNCRAVICPYLSASQSGIPQTVNQFGKKVIATNVGAFPEFIFNGENGYICDVNSNSLSEVLENNSFSDFSYDDFINLHPNLSWNVIEEEYIKLFQNIDIQ